MANSFTISEIATVVDCEHKTAPVVPLSEAYGFAVGTPALRGDRIDFAEAKPVSRETYDAWSQRTELRKGDIIIAREAPVGGLGWIDGSKKICLGQRTVCIRVTHSNLNSKFLFYKLHDPAVQQQIENLSSGSTVHHINVADIKELPLHNIPDLIYQEKAVKILSEIDDCIDLNLSIIANLENLSLKLYDYWFVQYDFPNPSGIPYKSSGGEMEWNDELQKDIPLGWKVCELSSIVLKNSEAFIQTGVKSNTKVIDLSVMPSNTFVLDTQNTSDNFSTNLFHLNKNDILFGAIRPYLRKGGFSPVDGLVTGTVHSFKVKRESEFNFALLTLVHESVFKFAIAHSKGTKMPVVASKDLLTYKVAYDPKIASSFQEILEFRDVITARVNQNMELRKLRDHLLPLVVNGYVASI